MIKYTVVVSEIKLLTYTPCTLVQCYNENKYRYCILYCHFPVSREPASKIPLYIVRDTVNSSQALLIGEFP